MIQNLEHLYKAYWFHTANSGLIMLHKEIGPISDDIASFVDFGIFKHVIVKQ